MENFEISHWYNIANTEYQDENLPLNSFDIFGLKAPFNLPWALCIRAWEHEDEAPALLQAGDDVLGDRPADLEVSLVKAELEAIAGLAFKLGDLRKEMVFKQVFV